METLKNKQVLKKGLQSIVKETKGITDRIFGVRYSNGNYWIYNGLLLTTKVFNLHYASIHCKVAGSQIKNDEVYIVSEIEDNHKQVFGI